MSHQHKFISEGAAADREIVVNKCGCVCCNPSPELDEARSSGGLHCMEGGDIVPGVCCPAIGSDGEMCGAPVVLRINTSNGGKFIGCLRFGRTCVGGEAGKWSCGARWTEVDKIRERVREFHSQRTPISSPLPRADSIMLAPSPPPQAASVLQSPEPTSSPSSTCTTPSRTILTPSPPPSQVARQGRDSPTWELGTPTDYVLWSDETGRRVSISPHCSGDPRLAHRWHRDGGSKSVYRYICAHNKKQRTLHAYIISFVTY